MPKCGCGGQTCGCAVTGGSGVDVGGTGTVSDPFIVSVDPGSLGLASAIQVANTTTVELSKTGSGGSGDPILLQAAVVVRSPDGTRWGPTISNSGVLTYAKL